MLSDSDVCMLKWHLDGGYIYKVSPFLQSLNCRWEVQPHGVWRTTLHLISEKSQWQLNARLVLEILVCVCVCVNVCVSVCMLVKICSCMCVSAWICISDCSMHIWPLAIQPLLILNTILSPQSNQATFSLSFIDNTLLAPSGQSEYCIHLMLLWE